MSKEEVAFYDAVSSNTEKDIDDEQLREIAAEIKEVMQENTGVDWTKRRKMKSKIKTEVKRLLREQGFKHSECEPLIEPILTQAEQLYADT